MSGIFKYLILICAVSQVFCITNVRDDVNWFKNGSRIRNKFVSGVVNGIFDVNCEETVNGGKVQGECMHKMECLRAGGKVGSACSLLGVCCIVEKTCSETTSAKHSYFIQPDKSATECALTVNVFNKDVCQIRLDFEEFDIAQPTSVEIPGANAQEVTFTSYQCNTDTFKVDEVKKNLGFSSLCGKNKGQHIYVPIMENQSRIVLRFNLKDRSADDNLPEAKWRLQIRQLECQRSVMDQHLTAPSKLMALYHSLKNKKHPKSEYDLIAPSNCLQYYSEKNGQFESFNFNSGNGPYIGPLNYAICFRKTPDICAVKYSFDGVFRMNFNPFRGPNEPVDDRCHPRLPASRIVSQDYLRISGGITIGKEFKDYFCNTDFNPMNKFAIGKSYGPLFVGVHSDEYRANQHNANPDDFDEIGFKLKYELENGNCDNLI